MYILFYTITVQDNENRDSEVKQKRDIENHNIELYHMNLAQNLV